MVIFKKSIFIFIFLLSIFFIKTNLVYGNGCSCSTPSDGCGTGCEDCVWCISPGPSHPSESIVGKIFNPVLNLDISRTPGVSYLQMMIVLFVRLVYIIGGLYFFVMFLLGGLQWISSSGEKAKLESAQKQITSALVGLAILLLSFAIIELIKSLFGFNLLEFIVPTL